MRVACKGMSVVLVLAATTIGSASADSFISEVRVGALAHDQGFTSHKEDGFDANGEILFGDTGWFGGGWTLRPNIGADISTDDGTSQVYFGGVAGHRLFGPLFFEVGAGGAVHDGKLDTNDPDKHSLGCRLLFHLQGDVGAELGDNWRLMAHIDHISNADLCDRNEGLTNIGVRLGYKF